MNQNSPLWTPSQEQIADSVLRHFADQTENVTGRKFDTYGKLHPWSCEGGGEFWDLLWDYCGVVGDKGERIVANEDRMPGADYFPDARMSFAENLLRFEGPEDAIVFIDGITSSHLSHPIPARKVLFLHADHRNPTGKIVPRSRGLIEAFDGDAIITATHAHKQRLDAELAHTTPVRVIPHYTDAAATPGAPRKDICTVSRLELTGKPIHQCIEAFVRIMHLIPDTNYLIYGAGLGEARLQQLIDHHDCGNRVRLMGHTANAPEVFSQSLFSLAPTMTEGFGLALLEALTCDCPVISFDVDYGPRELIRSGENGELVQPRDLDAIAAAILKVHADRDRYASGCAASVEYYSFDRYRDRYHQLIDDLVANRFYFDLSARDLKGETLRAMEGDIAGTTRLLLPGSPFDVIAYGCTSASMVIGEERVMELVREVRPEAKTTTPVTAARAAFAALGMKRIALLTPYIQEINDMMRAYFEGRGVPVPVMGSYNIVDDTAVARLSAESLKSAALELGRHEAVDGVFVACTSIRLATVVEELEQALGKPVTSSNHALAWHTLRLGGITEAIPGFGRLFRC